MVMLSDLPSGVSLPGPSCSSSAAKVISSDAWTWISWLMVRVRLSRVGSIAVIVSPLGLCLGYLGLAHSDLFGPGGLWLRRAPSLEGAGGSSNVQRFQPIHAGAGSPRRWSGTAS